MVLARGFSGRLLCWAAISGSLVGRSSSSFWGRQDRVLPPPQEPETSRRGEPPRLLRPSLPRLPFL